jgi:hypothetical protein
VLLSEVEDADHGTISESGKEVLGGQARTVISLQEAEHSYIPSKLYAMIISQRDQL